MVHSCSIHQVTVMLTKPSIAEALSAATALLLSSLPLSDATKAAARSIPAYDDYPLARSAVFDERGNALHCKYSNDQFRKRNEYSAALDFYIAGSSVMTGTITCPKAGDEEAFQASYQRSPTLKMYNPDFIRGDAGFTFNDSPPPDGTGSDPLRQVTLSTRRFRRRKPSQMDADLRKAFCSAAIETSKVKIGSFAELCTKVREFSEAAVKETLKAAREAANREEWTPAPDNSGSNKIVLQK